MAALTSVLPNPAAELRTEIDARFAKFELAFNQRLAELRAELSDRIRDTKVSLVGEADGLLTVIGSAEPAGL
jgi:hypothetical protein